ncbi:MULTISPECIES: polysaccharide pyruvyl transferase family protein [Flavobacteriaceae]|uniref:polysaccharide pyruvyl transferase family protein n=1 Tax=Flavobacteriaceae TaxID=49546 RepID=UPI001C0ED97E|nr:MULTISPECIES: polysaccharide pyruvyl transferase family protein [Allomuricauda]MDC6366827.1 polysaccharide pyruvyl transferase family protein [Muricauda sp. AC10]
MKKNDKQNYSRRDWLQLMALVNMGVLLPTPLLSYSDENPRKKKKGRIISTILIVSGWQDVNIGDIAHTPGLLHILESFLPDTRIILWKKSRATDAVKRLLKSNFPKVKVIYGDVDRDYNVTSEAVISAFETADVMIHGSGPYVVGRTNLEAWRKHTKKPYGIFGTTIAHIDGKLKDLLNGAAFVYTRETKSVKVLNDHGITAKEIGFAPDATFYLNTHDDERAHRFMAENGLEEKKFICAIPRLRKTPYYKFKPNNDGWSATDIQKAEALNNAKKEVDHAKLREAMIAWVRETGNKVLVCPEMTYQVDIMDELLIHPLPEDVRLHVVKRGYWLPDEAASVYRKAHTVLSFECHSPIIAARNGTPMFYLRQPEDTIKGHMYYDLGFDDWVFEIEETTGQQIADRLREVWKNYPQALGKLNDSMQKVGKIYARNTNVIAQLL